MMSIENYKKALESMGKEGLLNEISNLISDHGIQLQNKNTELQELKTALSRADLQLQFQIGEVDLRDKEIESLKGKRKPEDNDVLNILNNFSEVAYNQGCANDILKVIDYINWQKAKIDQLKEEKKTLIWLNQDLEKQADELKQENSVLSVTVKLQDEAIEQAIKGMSKEILEGLEERKERVKSFYGTVESVGVDIAIRAVKEIVKQKGVEVE